MPLTARHARCCRTLSRLTLITGISLSVFACGINFNLGKLGNFGSDTREQVQIPTPQLATRLLAEGEIAQAADTYEKLAASETDPSLRQEYLIKASELYFDSELYNDGARTFVALPPLDNTANTPLNNNTAPGANQLQQRLQILTAYNT